MSKKKKNLFKSFRPLPDTLDRLLSKYPEKKWDKLTYRKKVCITYIKWAVRPGNAQLRAQLVDLVQEWRRKETNRFGGKRSLLERMVRKTLFKLRKKEKLIEKNYEKLCETIEAQKKNKTGRFTDEVVAFRKSPENGKMGAETSKTRKNGCDWYVFAPDGTVYEITSLRAFCRERGMDWSHLSRTGLYPRSTYRGWRARKKNPFFDPLNFTD